MRWRERRGLLRRGEWYAASTRARWADAACRGCITGAFRIRWLFVITGITLCFAQYLLQGGALSPA